MPLVRLGIAAKLNGHMVSSVSRYEARRIQGRYDGRNERFVRSGQRHLAPLIYLTLGEKGSAPIRLAYLCPRPCLPDLHGAQGEFCHARV